MNSLASRIARHQASRRCFSSSTRSSKEKLVILGSGWGGYRVLQDIDKRRYDVSLISPTGVFSFTPLLAGASVGTLELRCTTENVRRYSKQINFAEAWADNVDFRKKQITCMPATEPPTGMSAETFRKPFVIDYDKLVISVGAYAQTFGVPGVKEHATFLKTVADARRIRNRIIECFEQASQPHLTDAQRAGLLHFAVVGGGPTGIEWSAELHDLITADMKNYYPKIHHLASITVYEVSDKILGGFDGKLQEYARERFQREGINVRSNHHVEKVEAGKLFVKEIGEVPCGLIVWSTGLALNPLVDSMQGVAKTKKALLTDGNLRVLDDKEQPMRDVWAIGDCAMVKDGAPLPATAQAANQKAMYVSKSLNMMAKGRGATAEAFEFKSKGSLAYIGDWKALMDNSQSGHENVSGSAAFVLWRSAYTITTLSLRNKITVPFYWFMNWAFGRDIARF